MFGRMTLLDEIIDGSSDGTVATADLLRKVQVAATRVGATDVVRWVKQELQGYGEDDELPSYRTQTTNVMGLFTGPMQSRIRQQLPSHPEFSSLFNVDMRQPLLEVQSFADGTEDPSREWPASAVQRYETMGIYTIQFYGLFSAANVITRQSLRGIIDTVRSKAMEFALELQMRFPDAGTVGGPTVLSNSAVAQTVFNITNNITGDGASIAAGSGIRQQSNFRGDTSEFKKRAELLGLSPEDADAFVQAVSAERDLDGSAVRSFLGRIRTGAIHLAKSVSYDVVAGALIDLAKTYLGLH
jgi:hypothetical protein